MDNLKTWLFKKELLKKLQQKSTAAKENGSYSDKIGILFDGTLQSEREIVEKFVSFLKYKNRQPYILSFINQKIKVEGILDNSYSLLDIKWSGIPYGMQVENFTSENFHHLICLAKEIQPHYEYIIKMCNARFKIGIDTIKGHDCFDLIVDTRENTETEGVINEIETVMDKLSGVYAK